MTAASRTSHPNQVFCGTNSSPGDSAEPIPAERERSSKHIVAQHKSCTVALTYVLPHLTTCDPLLFGFAHK